MLRPSPLCSLAIFGLLTLLGGCSQSAMFAPNGSVEFFRGRVEVRHMQWAEGDLELNLVGQTGSPRASLVLMARGQGMSDRMQCQNIQLYVDGERFDVPIVARQDARGEDRIGTRVDVGLIGVMGAAQHVDGYVCAEHLEFTAPQLERLATFHRRIGFTGTTRPGVTAGRADAQVF